MQKLGILALSYPQSRVHLSVQADSGRLACPGLSHAGGHPSLDGHLKPGKLRTHTAFFEAAGG